MAVTVDIDARDLVKFVQNIKKAPKVIQFAASKSLNKIGEKLVDQVVDSIKAQTGLTESVIRSKVIVHRSTPTTLEFKINASRAILEAPATRPMRGRRFDRRPDDYFHAQEMVDIVTMEDDDVCAICEEIQEEGPYPIEEARTLIPAHPHCRCAVQLHRSRRELPVEFRKGKNVSIATVTLDKLKEELQNEVKFSLRALK